jgi:hypothetical protein
MVLLIDLKFVRSCLKFIFNLTFIFQLNFFKMASVRVHFSLGFTTGGGFPAEQFLLRRNSILLCGKKNTESRQMDFGRFNESEFKSFAVHGRLLSMTDRKMHQT